MLIKVDSFRGAVQDVAPHLIENNQAQDAVNCRLDNGELRALRGTTLESALAKAGTIESLHLFADQFWFHWNGDVDAVRGQVPGDTTERTYFTGDGVPKVTWAAIATAGGSQEYPTNSYTNGVPQPDDVPTVEAVDDAVTWYTIDGILLQNPVQVEATGSNVTTGQTVQIKNAAFPGNPAAAVTFNGEHTVTRIDTDNFTLDGVDGGWLFPYTADSGEVRKIADSSALDVVSRVYVMTWVATIGGAQIEGPPSEPSAVVDVGAGQYASLSDLPTTPPSGYNITGKRIYRFEGSNTAAGYRFVAELDLVTATYDDDVESSDLGSAMESEDYFPPPDDLHSLIALPNGVMAGLSGNEICFSEPYLPHAWPPGYRQAMDVDGVALGAIGNTVLVTTTSHPYVVMGSDPRNMGMNKLEIAYGCMSKRGLVDMGYSIVYPGSDGLVSYRSGQLPRVITEGLISEKDWRALDPASMHAYRWDDKYLAFYDTGTAQGGLFIDPHGQQFAYIDLYATAGWVDDEDGTLYLVVDGEVVVFDDAAAAALTYRWRSKEYVNPRPVGVSVARIEAGSYPVQFRLWGDGTQRVDTAVADNAPFRLPGGYRAQRWFFELEGTGDVRQVEIASTMQEIKSA